MWIVFSLLAAFTAAIAVTLTKAGVKNTDSSLAFAIQSVLILLVSWTAVWWQRSYPEITKLDKRAWTYLVIAGIATCFSSLFAFRALKLGDAAVVTSLERLSLVFAVIFAVIFLKESVNWKVITGAALMIGGAVLVALSREGS